ncbi:putative protein-serine/threonine phosphatase [Helianthus annuus]|nr:putative protein-serine/threonine phosphatase [Helianthus annuus]KAJ0720457.1 putative protein-serine/threonine phosphatase [Helianthus annuus]KAJ0723660.1 putative protein-serine/threonine phosphatase [Helianthus annuus]
MPERDYALEMWRLLDTGTHLITPKQLLNRVVCVKSGMSFILTKKNILGCVWCMEFRNGYESDIQKF